MTFEIDPPKWLFRCLDGRENDELITKGLDGLSDSNPV